MKIPKIISKKEHEYIFVKQCNENLFLYKDMLYGYTECFTKYDLGYRTYQVEDKKTKICLHI